MVRKESVLKCISCWWRGWAEVCERERERERERDLVTVEGLGEGSEHK